MLQYCLYTRNNIDNVNNIIILFYMTCEYLFRIISDKYLIVLCCCTITRNIIIRVPVTGESCLYSGDDDVSVEYRFEYFYVFACQSV